MLANISSADDSPQQESPTTYVTLTQLSAEAGMRPLSMKKSLVRYGIHPEQARVVGGRKVQYVVTREQADTYLRMREEVPSATPASAPASVGGVYLLLPDPVARLDRVKVGWASSFSDRWQTHRCIAPELLVLRAWPTAAEWLERMALSVAMNTPGVVPVSGEVFDVEDLKDVLGRLDASFGMHGVRPLDLKKMLQGERA